MSSVLSLVIGWVGFQQGTAALTIARDPYKMGRLVYYRHVPSLARYYTSVSTMVSFINSLDILFLLFSPSSSHVMNTTMQRRKQYYYMHAYSKALHA
jgi:hypothetical protein